MNEAVFDTNVLVSGFLSPHGPPGRIVEWLREGSVRAVLDDRILKEYSEVLNGAVFGLPRHEVGLVLDAVRRHAQWVTVPPATTARDVPDPDDAPLLECARSADVVLVTGNTRHYPKRVAVKVRVLTPAEYVRTLQARAKGDTHPCG